MNIAIVGATGNVGRKTLEVLERKNISFNNIFLLASSKSVGTKIFFKSKEYTVTDLENFDFSKAKIIFLLLEKKFQKNLFLKQLKVLW